MAAPPPQEQTNSPAERRRDAEVGAVRSKCVQRRSEFLCGAAGVGVMAPDGRPAEGRAVTVTITGRRHRR